jgi:protein-S-isoprenylcysteine O-methyltransferase Ste14
MASGISDQTSPDSTKLGGWLFRHRTAIPIPIAIALVVIPGGDAALSWTLVIAGVMLTLLGEALRLASVHRIGVISRTRSERLGPLVTSGPFAYVRNPLYIGNMLIWVGFSVTAGLVWAVPVVLSLLLAEYHAIVRWEEQRLQSRYGDGFAAYRAGVPRWLPRTGAWHRVAPIPHPAVPGTDLSAAVPGTDGREGVPGTDAPGDAPGEGFSWRETFFSERGTLIAIVAGYVLLWLKARS